MAQRRSNAPRRRARDAQARAGEFAPGVRLGYRPALDGVRAIAVLAVMSWHFVTPGVRGGFLGVDLFFVLSGFLITTLLIEEWNTTGAVSLSRFYLRRSLRLLPALLVVLAVTAPFVPRLWTFMALFYVANWGVPFGYFGVSPIRHLWSLSVEEQFYIVWPVLLAALLRMRAPRKAIYAVVALAAAASVVFKFAAWNAPGDWIRLYHGSDGRADQLLIGCGLGLFLAWSTLPRKRWFRTATRVAVIPSLVGLGLLFVNAAVYWEFFYRQAGFALVALAAATLLLHLMVAPFAWLIALLEWRPLVAIGRISYGLYLWHQPVGWFTDPRNFEFVPILPRPAQFALRVALTFAVAGVSHALVERPMLRLKSRFAPEGRQP